MVRVRVVAQRDTVNGEWIAYLPAFSINTISRPTKKEAIRAACEAANYPIPSGTTIR